MEILKELGVTPAVIAAQVTGFVLLWWVLSKYLFRPVMEMLGTREQEIRGTYEAAEGERTRAEELRTGYEQRIAGVEAEARARIQAAIKEAENAKDEILTEARTRAEGILTRAQEDLAREREKTLTQLRESVVDLSLSAAGKLIGESLDEEKHRRLVSDFIDRIGAPQ